MKDQKDSTVISQTSEFQSKKDKLLSGTDRTAQPEKKQGSVNGAVPENETVLCCPICGGKLVREEKSYRCEKRHSFDRARQGYVNLLPVQQKHSLNPGDTKEMLSARRRFLDSGHYHPICQDVADCILRYQRREHPLLADIGCGEGYYTAAFERLCGVNGIGADIAKDGVRMACQRSKTILWLVATASRLPFREESVDVLTAMFSLLLPEEYERVLKPGGCVIEVTVGSDHLRELKEIIYDEVFEQHKHPVSVEGALVETECTEHRYRMTLPHRELQDLLLMTPHFWRIRQERRRQLEETEQLTLTVHYWVRVLQKTQ